MGGINVHAHKHTRSVAPGLECPSSEPHSQYHLAGTGVSPSWYWSTSCLTLQYHLYGTGEGLACGAQDDHMCAQ